MNEHHLGQYIQILLFIAFIIPVIIFFLTQQRTLELIHPLNRRMPPAQVWLQLIPFFSLVWQFFVIRRISDSIRNELNTPTGDSIFAETSVPANHSPTYNSGISYAALICITTVSFLPMLKFITGLAGLGAWIIYWVQLSRYKKQLKNRQ